MIAMFHFFMALNCLISLIGAAAVFSFLTASILQTNKWSLEGVKTPAAETMTRKIKVNINGDQDKHNSPYN